MAASAARATESLKRADALQCSVNELQSKCKDLESQLHAAKQSTEDANLKAAERELQAKLQAEAEASHMYRQLKSEHAADVQALLVQVNDASAASAADRTSHASVLQELRSCQAAHAAALSEKDRVIASKQSEISEAEARFHSYKKHAEEESAAAASSHAQAYRTQEAAHAASVEALQATYEMQLRQMRATSQGAIESVGKSQDALTSVRCDSFKVNANLYICVESRARVAGFRQPPGRPPTSPPRRNGASHR
jgi:chromosome segregation protein